MSNNKRYALVTVSGEVDNVIVWDGDEPWSATAGLAALACPDVVGPGWTFDGDSWSPPDDQAT